MPQWILIRRRRTMRTIQKFAVVLALIGTVIFVAWTFWVGNRDWPSRTESGRFEVPR
jgi:hypothetical protein